MFDTTGPNREFILSAIPYPGAGGSAKRGWTRSVYLPRHCAYVRPSVRNPRGVRTDCCTLVTSGGVRCHLPSSVTRQMCNVSGLSTRR